MKRERNLFEELGNYDGDCKMDIEIIQGKRTIYSGRMDRFKGSELERKAMPRKVDCVECRDGVLKIYLKGWERK